MVFSELSVVTTAKEKTMPSATKSSIVRVTQTCEIAASPHSTLRGKQTERDTDTDSDLHSVILVKSLAAQFTSTRAQASVWELNSRRI